VHQVLGVADDGPGVLGELVDRAPLRGIGHDAQHAPVALDLQRLAGLEDLVIHLDTHVVVWLYDAPARHLPPATRKRLDGAELFVSPMVVLEMEHLAELGRIAARPDTILATLAARLGLSVSTASWAEAVGHAREIRWTRDPFDRLIVGNAVADGAQLVTKDETIRSNFAGAWWEP
jgi:PIN domain nuclease of toxin-antitoxin system